MSTCSRAFAGLALLAAPLAVGAQQIVPTSYTAPPGYTGNFPYLDETGTQLIDGELGSAPLVAPEIAPPYVAWNIHPTILFNFASPVTIGEVRIGFYRHDVLGVPLPPVVHIGSTVFPLTGTEIPHATRGWISFAGSWTGSQLAVTLFDQTPVTENPTGYTGVMVDEFEFYAGVSAVPEPTSVALFGTGLLLAGLWGARRRTSTCG